MSDADQPLSDVRASGREPSRGSVLDRRQFLRRTARSTSSVLAAAAMGSLLLAACGDDDAATSADGSGKSTGENSLDISNWITYIDDQSIQRFEAETGIKVSYVEDINDNDGLFAKIQPSLSNGKSIGRDIIVPTYWMAARLARLQWAQALPITSIPNSKNLRRDLLKPPWDPTGTMTLPWQTGMTGIAYNRKAAGRELRSVDDLFDPAFKGRIGMLTEMRDTLGLTMLSLGTDPSQATFELADAAFTKLERANADGQIRQFTGNDYQDDLLQGNFIACVGWSGDLLQLGQDNPDLAFVIPEEGGIRWADCMMIPIKAEHVDAAAQFMNFVYEPANAARITAAVQYISPVEGVADELRKLGGTAAALADNPLVFPDDATRTRLQSFASLPEDEEALFDARFAKLTGN